MHTDLNMYNADLSRHRDFREQRKMRKVEPNTNNMNVVSNADVSHHNRDFGEHHPQMLEPNTYSDRNAVYADVLSDHRTNIGEQRREMQEANTRSDMNVVSAHLCRHRKLDEQRRTMPNTSDLLNKALDAIHTIVDCVALVAKDNSPSNNHNPMYNNNFRSSSSPPLLSSSSMDFQQHLQQLQHHQQMKHELHQVQKRQQELVQMMSTNTTTMTQTYNSPDAPMSMSLSQFQQEHKKEQQQQLQSSTASASATITSPITQEKTVNLGRTNFSVDLSKEAEEPTRTVDNNNTVPSELDIRIGRGRGVDNHQGNIYYRKMVESFRKQYEGISQKSDKTTFIRAVVAIMYEHGHQFVKKVKDPTPTNNGSATTSSTGTWVSVDRHVARSKVSHSFRNAKRLSQTASVSASTNNK